MHRLEPFRLIEHAALDREAYQGLLAGVLRFHNGIGAAARSHGLGRFSGALNKVELLVADLRAFGEVIRMPECIFEVPSAPHALGALYVAEGSMFGGKKIAEQLRYLGSGDAGGMLFFRGTSEDLPRWNSLVRELEMYADDASAEAAIIRGAAIAFRWFEDCVTSTQALPPASWES